jgi:recombinational DNA repair ATPase RecF
MLPHQIQDKLKVMAAASITSATVNDELEDLRSANQALSSRIGSVESKLASERAETSTQLDALKTQLQREVAEEAKKAAAAAKEEVKAEVGSPPDVKAEIGQALNERLPALKKELDELLEGQMKVGAHWR